MIESATELVAAFATRERSPVEVLEQCIARIEARSRELNVFTALCLDRARDEALLAEDAWIRGEPTGPLCGVPFAAKDLFDTEGLETSCGSALLRGRIPKADAEAVARIRAAGGILVGKTATHEFAWGLTMRNEVVGHTRNPFAPDRSPGGSSGGSAAALAAGMVPLAIGTDTGGSIRLPSSFCGTWGMKPTHGAVPLTGCWPLAPAYDHAGPMTRSPGDLALLFAVLTAKRGRPPLQEVTHVDPPSRIGVPRELHVALPPATQRVYDAAIARLGDRVVEVDIPDPHDVIAAYMPYFFVQALDVHREAGFWPDRAGEYSDSVRTRLRLAEASPPEALEGREDKVDRVRRAYDEVFGRADSLLTPIVATAPPPLLDGDDDLRGTVTAFVAPQNLLGLPAVAFPAGTDDLGLPIGLQLTAPRGQDRALLVHFDDTSG